LRRVADSTVVVAEPATEEESTIENIDTVILSYGGIEDNRLYYDLVGRVRELYQVGDCKGVRKIMWATDDGARLARAI